MKVALYRHFDAHGSLLYVGIAANPFARTKAHMAVVSWAHEVTRIEIEWHEARGAAETAEVCAIRNDRPRHNIAHSLQAPVFDILSAIDLDALKAELGVKDRTIRLVRERRIFPASWYPTVKRLCDAASVDCPLCAFNWKREAAE